MTAASVCITHRPRLRRGVMRFYLAWTRASAKAYAFSLQFFDEAGEKALQVDNMIRRQLLTLHEIDIRALPPGAYSVQLIVYDYETRASQGGTRGDEAARFERELEIARFEV